MFINSLAQPNSNAEKKPLHIGQGLKHQHWQYSQSLLQTREGEVTTAAASQDKPKQKTK